VFRCHPPKFASYRCDLNLLRLVVEKSLVDGKGQSQASRQYGEVISTSEAAKNPNPLPQVAQPPIQLGRIKNTRGVTMSNLQNAVQELREKRKRAQIEIEKLDQIISGIESLDGTGADHDSNRPTRIISAASRRKMAPAQKAQWASIRKQSQPTLVGKTTVAAPAKRTMSASARRKIAAAQKARWAKVRAQEKQAA